MIVVDGGSTDATSELKHRFPINFVRQKGTFQPSGLNYGISFAHGEILVFIDDDIIAEKHWLERIVETFGKSDIYGVGGSVIISGLGRMTTAEKKLSTYLRLRNRIFAAICENKLEETGLVLRSGYVTPNLDKLTGGCTEVNTFQGCNMAFRKEVFKKVGLFDESYIPSAFRIETEFCLRACSEGFRLIYNPEAIIYHQVHDAHGSWTQGPALGRILFLNSANHFLFVMRGRKRIPRFSWLRFILVQLLSTEECLRLAVRRRTIAYLLGPWGNLVALRSWILNSNNVRAGQIPCLGAQQ